MRFIPFAVKRAAGCTRDVHIIFNNNFRSTKVTSYSIVARRTTDEKNNKINVQTL